MGHSKAISELFRALWDGGTLAVLPDSELMRRFINHREEEGDIAFETLVRRHGPMVFTTCRRILRHEHEVEDAFQATFLVLVSKMYAIRGERLEPWLRKVARRVAIRAKVAIDRRKVREGAPVDLSAIAIQTGTNAEILALAMEELNRLPANLRNALILCDLEGMKTDQAAAKLQRHAGTLRNDLMRARRLLRKRLLSRGLELSTTAGCLTIPAGIQPISRPMPTNLIARTAHLAILKAAGLDGEAATSAALETLIRGTLRMMALRKLGGMLGLVLVVSIMGGVGLRALGVQVALSSPQPIAAAGLTGSKEKPRFVGSLEFRPDPAAARDLLQGASPDSVRFVPSSHRPPGIIKEPRYRSNPRYAVFRVGTGPRSTYALAVDEPADGDWRIYVDVNRNGDLSDDGDGRYDALTKDQYDPYRIADFSEMVWNEGEMISPLRSTLREKFLMLRISRGTADSETSSGPHGVSFRRVVYEREPLWNHEGTDYLRITGTAAGVGQLPDPPTNTMQDGCLILESVGLVYPERLRPGMHFGAFEPQRVRKTVQQAWFMRVMKGIVTRSVEGSRYNLNCSTAVMTYFGRRVEWIWRPDGSRVDVAETDKDQAPVFRVGSPAPHFDFELADTRRIKLTDLHRKVVVLATCRLNESPPNLALLEHLDSIARATRESDVVVIAVATLDTRKTYDRFVARHRFDWSIPIAFDSASTSLLPYPDGYNTWSDDPFIYIIDRDGKLGGRLWVEGVPPNRALETWLRKFTEFGTWVRFHPGDDTLETCLKNLGVRFQEPNQQDELPNFVWASAIEDCAVTKAPK